MLDLYGTQGGDGSFAANCLLARRLAERGVRFIQLYHRDWDHHGGVKDDIAGTAERSRPAARAALINDLKQRGMLDDTLVVWGGEFGRTPMAQGNGRDHHIKGFSMWLAGGGIKGGITHGATDELGYDAVEDVGPRPRPARHDAAPAGHRPQAADVPLPGPRLPPDRRGGQRGASRSWRSMSRPGLIVVATIACHAAAACSGFRQCSRSVSMPEDSMTTTVLIRQASEHFMFVAAANRAKYR